MRYVAPMSSPARSAAQLSNDGAFDAGTDSVLAEWDADIVARSTAEIAVSPAAATGPLIPEIGEAMPRSGIIIRTLRRARHALLPAALFAPAYGAAITTAVIGHMVWREQAIGMRMLAVVILFALGGTIAGFAAWLTAATIAGARRRAQRFAAMTFALTLATAGFTAFLFFLQFQVYYAQWHDEAFSRMWVWQVLFTGASAVYIFISSGLRMLLPFGLPVLFFAAWLFARKPRI